MNGMMEWMYHGGGWAMGLVGLVWFAILVGVVVVVLRMMRRPPSETKPRETPRDILDQRLAKGEIDREEYEVRRDALRHG